MTPLHVALSPAEGLRDLPSVAQPDPRTAVIDGDVSASLAAHHRRIDAIRIGSAVPEPIAIQFETARNLFLYAWHVYRFYMVGAAHALTTLEYGLRMRLPKRLPEPYQHPRQKQPMLAGLLGYAMDQGMIRNEGFRRWHSVADDQARQRRSLERMRLMVEGQLESMEWDDSEPVEITDQDRRWDLVGVLRESLPSTRNTLAHGSDMLTSQVFGTLELVAEILDQVYPASDSESV